MKKQIILSLVILVLLISVIGIVYAKSDNANPSSNGYESSVSSDISSSNSGSDSSSNSDSSTSSSSNRKDKTTTNSGDDSEEGDDGSGSSSKKTKETQTITLLDENQNQYEVTTRVETKERDGEEQIKIKVRNVEIDSDVELEQEGGSLKAKLSNGNKQGIKIMPDTASQTAIEKMQTKGINIQLKEVGEGNDLSVVYEAEGNKSVKFLGLFKVRAQITAIISAENGEVLRLEQPWWYFLAFGKGAVDCDADNLDLCDDELECSEAGLIWYEDSCIASCPTDEYFCDDDVTILLRDESLNCEFDVDSCPILPVCDADNLDLCLDETSCIGVTGYWYDDICNAEAEVVLVCDINNLDLCLDEDSCEDALVNGTWNNVTLICG